VDADHYSRVDADHYSWEDADHYSWEDADHHSRVDADQRSPGEATERVRSDRRPPSRALCPAGTARPDREMGRQSDRDSHRVAEKRVLPAYLRALAWSVARGQNSSAKISTGMGSTRASRRMWRLVRVERRKVGHPTAAGRKVGHLPAAGQLTQTSRKGAHPWTACAALFRAPLFRAPLLVAPLFRAPLLVAPLFRTQLFPSPPIWARLF
jgi:hypothetical protein